MKNLANMNYEELMEKTELEKTEAKIARKKAVPTNGRVDQKRVRTSYISASKKAKKTGSLNDACDEMAALNKELCGKGKRCR